MIKALLSSIVLGGLTLVGGLILPFGSGAMAQGRENAPYRYRLPVWLFWGDNPKPYYLYLETGGQILSEVSLSPHRSFSGRPEENRLICSEEPLTVVFGNAEATEDFPGMLVILDTDDELSLFRSRGGNAADMRIQTTETQGLFWDKVQQGDKVDLCLVNGILVFPANEPIE